MMQAMRVIFHHECKLLRRHAHEWAIPLAFFALILFLFPLAFTISTPMLPGCVWIAAIFANCLSLQTLFLSDLEKNSLEQWALAPTPFALLLLAKLAAHWVMTQLPFILFTVMLCLLFNINAYSTTVLILSLLLSSPVLILLCSLSLALAAGLKQQGLLLGLIITPLILPLFILGVNASVLAAHGGNVVHPLAAMAGICLLSIVCLPAAISSAWRMAIDH
jgi:heme exporter protein B